MKTTVIHHSADYDGIFCREIARKFLPDAELIGWDFADKPLAIPEGQIYILDLPVDRVFGFTYKLDENLQSILSHVKGECPNDTDVLDYAVREQCRIIWIDHHKSSIDTHPSEIPGYRIDGVAACRLAWQWFKVNKHDDITLPTKDDYKNRIVSEPLAVRLAGEYDVWEHKLSNGADIAFQFGLDSQPRIKWEKIFEDDGYATDIVVDGETAMACYAKRDADVMRSRSFLVKWEGLTFLALNTARCNSNTFNALDKPETGHDALMAFCYDGTQYNFSLYHAAHRKELDLSEIAKKHGGGGHRGACGFRVDKLPF